MIIFGWTTRLKPTSLHGQFFCPKCRVNSTYAPLRRKTYLHLFFIPLVPLSDDPHGVQCLACKTCYEDDVLEFVPQEQQQFWECPRCRRKWPDTNVRCPFCRVRPDGTAA